MVNEVLLLVEEMRMKTRRMSEELAVANDERDAFSAEALRIEQDQLCSVLSEYSNEIRYSRLRPTAGEMGHRTLMRFHNDESLSHLYATQRIANAYAGGHGPDDPPGEPDSDGPSDKPGGGKHHNRSIMARTMNALLKVWKGIAHRAVCVGHSCSHCLS